MSYELNASCNRPKEMMELYRSLSQNILDVFNEHGVQIMTPAYQADPEKPKIVPKDQWFIPSPSILKKLKKSSAMSVSLGGSLIEMRYFRL